MPSVRRPPVWRIAITMTISLAVAAVAVLLGIWQYGRHVDRADAMADFEAAAHLAPAEVGDVAPIGTSELPPGAQWRTVTATGTIDLESLTVLRNRPVNSTPAWQYLAWLDAEDGSSLLLNLAWIPQPDPASDPAVPALVDGERVTVTAVLREWEPDDGKGAGTSITRITPDQLPTPVGDPIPGYGMLREICGTDGCVETPVGGPVPLPALTVGPHLSYAWQWWLFAVMAPTGGVLLLRRDAQVAAESDAPTEESPGGETLGNGASKPARASAGRRRRRSPSDEEIEDAL